MTKKITHVCSKEAELATMETRQQEMANKVDDIHKVLLGNGRPGVLDRLKRLETIYQVTVSLLAFTITVYIAAKAAGII